MTMQQRICNLCFVTVCFSLLFVSLICFPVIAQAEDSVCARVRIEISQELTLERQAFDAMMRINNGLDTLSIDNVNVDVTFADEDGNPVLATSDPDNTSALFYIRIDSMEGISDVSGSGTVAPNTTAEIHWLIVPAPGAAGPLPSGTLYFIGATLTYSLGGEENIMEVAPDYIYVKPLPLLTLDYFLTKEIYADDAFTPEIEPPEPFTLGLRVINNGQGVADNVQIDSAQPRIVDNEQGLPIGFKILGSSVNDAPDIASLLVSLGDIEPEEATVARWTMTTSLSGEFVDFTATFSHADELGGELTSILDATNAHLLVHDVLVDLSGRDAIRDFLAKDGDILRLYESNGIDTVVTDQTALTSSISNDTYIEVNMPSSTGFIYTRQTDPFEGNKVVAEVIRSDGKHLSSENVWFSKSRAEDNSWQYYLNIFDVNTTGIYLIDVADPAPGPQAPVLQFIPDRTGVEGMLLSFVVQASDPDGTMSSLLTSPLPASATFTDNKNGSGVFSWTPAIGQRGQYSILFTASDGYLTDSQYVLLTINSVDDRDGDGLLNDLEDTTCTNPDNPDTDNDGFNDGVEDANHNGTVDPGETDPCDPDYYPVAMAGHDRNAIVTGVVFMDGTDSYDPDGQLIDYLWTFISVPSGSTVTDSSLSDQQSPNPAFIPDVAGEYVLEIEVTDGVLSASADVTVNVSPANVAPNADAGPDQNAITGVSVKLNGNNSYDPDNGPDLLSYLWSFKFVPTFSLLTDNDITGRDQPIAGFVPDSIGEYELRLTVNDRESSDSDTLHVLADNLDIAPNANAGDDLRLNLGETAVIDGHGSNDPDNEPNPLSFNWQLVSRPVGSAISGMDIEKGDTAAPTFLPDFLGTYVLRITVTDGAHEDSDNVAVRVHSSADRDGDGDVDGLDLLDIATTNPDWFELYDFAAQFGKKF